MQGRTIRLYLVDGSPTGTLTAEIINWTGKVLVSPRAQLADLAKREEAKRTGIYCLTGRDPENPSHECVYIGESDNVLSRLALHDKDDSKDFWTRTVIVTSKDGNLTKAHARYLEARLIQMVRAAGRAKLTNSTAPPAPPLPEADVADMEYFLGQIQIILPVLGLSFLQPKPDVSKPNGGGAGASPLFRLESVGVRAEAREINGEFVVLKGSTARRHGAASWGTYRDLRDDLIESGKLVDASDPDLLVFAENVPFSSPSAAASVVRAGNTNGRGEWKEATTGKTYAEWQELQLKLAGVGQDS
ncbi:MAG: GIY-YIG nuclease family protein [Bacteroidetes bacterium]|nr:MAG: GIY-YIG nuclease family protein [Bacteroidota bacterium]